MEPRTVSVLVALNVSGALSSQSLVTTGLATMASAQVTGSATIGTSLIVTGPITGTAFSGVGTSLTALNASNLGSGTVPIERLGTIGSPGAATFLRGDNSWSQAVTQVTVATLNGVSASVATQGTTPELTFTLGDITPSSIVTGSINASGAITSTTGFNGSGENLTALNASNLGSGTVALQRLGTGTPDGTKFLSGTNAWATAVTTVTVATANGVSGSIATQGTTPVITITLGAITPTSVASVGTVSGTTITASTGFSGPGSTITALNASNLGSGTVPIARLGSSGTAGATTFLRGNNAWATALTAVSIVTANGISASIANATTTPAITLTLGAITPTSVASTGEVSGTTFTGDGSALTALNATNITSGQLAIARIAATGTPAITNFLSGNGTWANALTAVSVVTANGVSASIATGTTTPALTFSLGAITPSSVVATGNVTGATLSSSGLATLNSASVTNNATVGGTLGVTGTITAPSFIGALVGTSAYTPVLTAGVFAGLNSAAPTIPQFGLISTVAPANAKASSFYVAANGTLNWTLLLDDLATNTSFMTVARSGATATNITFTGTAITLTGAVTGTSFSGVGTSLTALNASNLGSGTVPVARLGLSGTPSASTYLAGDNSWKTTPTGTVTAVTVATANGVSATVATQGTTPALTFSLGAITPSSVSTGSLAASGPATFGATISVTGNASFSTLSSSGVATLDSATISDNATVGGTLGVTGNVTAPVFIPTSTTVPTTGIYSGGTAAGVAISTGTLERLEITSAGLMTVTAAMVEAINAVAASAVDCSKGNFFTKTYSGALTWTFINVPTGVYYAFKLRLIRGASGTQTWPSSVRWTGGSAPNLTNTNGGSDIFEFMTNDGGTRWHAYRLVTSTS